MSFSPSLYSFWLGCLLPVCGASPRSQAKNRVLELDSSPNLAQAFLPSVIAE
jgi:hypothetical protein